MSFKGLNSCEIYAALKTHKSSSSSFINVFSLDSIPLKVKKRNFLLFLTLRGVIMLENTGSRSYLQEIPKKWKFLTHTHIILIFSIINI